MLQDVWCDTWQYMSDDIVISSQSPVLGPNLCYWKWWGQKVKHNLIYIVYLYVHLNNWVVLSVSSYKINVLLSVFFCPIWECASSDLALSYKELEIYFTSQRSETLRWQMAQSSASVWWWRQWGCPSLAWSVSQASYDTSHKSTYRVSKKRVILVQMAIEGTRSELWIKVGGVLENSGYFLSDVDEYKNSPIL